MMERTRGSNDAWRIQILMSTPEELCERARRLLSLGWTEHSIARAFGWTHEQVRKAVSAAPK